MKHLLDTSAIVAHFRGEAGGEIVQALFDDKSAAICIAAPSMAELGRTLRTLGVPPNEISDALYKYGEAAQIVSIDRAVALRALAMINACSERLPLVDALIAAAASLESATLVHRDAHMAAIPDEFVSQHRLPGRRTG